MKHLIALLAALALVAAACGSSDGATVATGEPQAPAEEPAAEPAEEEPASEEEPAAEDAASPDEAVEEEAAEEEAPPAEEEAPPAEEEAPPAEEEPQDEPAEGFPVVIAAGNGEVTIGDRPERVVSISTVSTETLFAIGAGDQVIAVDDQSNFPPEAPMTDLSGFAPSVEAIAELEPDLVFLSFDPGDVVAGLQALDIPVILHGTAFTLADAYTQIEQTGAATGHVAEAAELVAQMQADIDAAVASAPSFDTPPTIFHEVSFDLYSSTSSTFIGQLYALFGVENIADPADADGFGFPQLSAEYVLEADPDIIFLGDVLYGESADTVAARPGWDALTAVQNGNIVELDTDVASRWGPRIPQLVQEIAAGLQAFAAVAA